MTLGAGLYGWVYIFLLVSPKSFLALPLPIADMHPCCDQCYGLRSYYSYIDVCLEPAPSRLTGDTQGRWKARDAWNWTDSIKWKGCYAQ